MSQLGRLGKVLRLLSFVEHVKAVERGAGGRRGWRVTVFLTLPAALFEQQLQPFNVR